MHPLKVTITNYPEDKIEYLEVSNNVENENATTRKISFSNTLYIDTEDFLEEKPNKKWKRLSKDIEVRLFGAYFIKCNEVIKDDKGNVIELKCTYDPATKSGSGFDERKPNGTIHYVDAKTCKKAKFLLFEPLLLDEASDKSFLENLNPNSITELNGFVEESLGDTNAGDKYQFLRVGYFATDKLSTKDNLIFNRITPLKSSM
jgi:glutaminyl-tRNA synthetase